MIEVRQRGAPIKNQYQGDIPILIVRSECFVNLLVHQGKTNMNLTLRTTYFVKNNRANDDSVRLRN